MAGQNKMSPGAIEHKFCRPPSPTYPCYLRAGNSLREYGKWSPMSHEYSHIEEEISRNLDILKRHKLSEDDERARQGAFNEFLRDSNANSDGRTQKDRDHRYLKAVFDILNRNVFGGALNPKVCYWEFCTGWALVGKYGETDAPQDQQGATDPGNIYCCITIYERDDIPDHSDRIHRTIETLAHEMGHALLEIYACRNCNNCCKDPARKEGVTGHGPVWLRVTANIQDHSSNWWPKEFNLHRETGFVSELVETGMPLNRWQVESWDLDFQEVWQEYKAEVRYQARKMSGSVLDPSL